MDAIEAQAHQEATEKGLKPGTTKYERFMEDRVEQLDVQEMLNLQREANLSPEAGSVAKLQQALNAEGDYMGHCVGGYCDDVLGGQARVFSLRSPEGKSLVTVEARPRVKAMSEAEQAFYDEYGRLPRDMQELDDWGMENDIPIDAEDWGTAPQAWRITQIKGSGKKDPMQRITPEDLKLVQPYVQDFLNSQEWSDIRDLSNAGLRDMRSLYGRDLPQGAKRFMTPAEQQEFNKLYPDLESQMSKDLKAGDWEPDEPIEFAQGGLVRAPDYFDNLDVFLRG